METPTAFRGCQYVSRSSLPILDDHTSIATLFLAGNMRVHASQASLQTERRRFVHQRRRSNLACFNEGDGVNSVIEMEIINSQPNGPSRALLLFRDRKSTRLNSSHSSISYAVFCLKKK